MSQHDLQVGTWYKFRVTEGSIDEHSITCPTIDPAVIPTGTRTVAPPPGLVGTVGKQSVSEENHCHYNLCDEDGSSAAVSGLCDPTSVTWKGYVYCTPSQEVTGTTACDMRGTNCWPPTYLKCTNISNK